MAGPDRDQLVQQHLNLVQAIARKVRKQITSRVEVDDLVGYGSKGLLEAARRFDPSHGVTFTTFAYYRIRGAMLDGLRTMGWYSRGDYARYRAEERANEYLQNRAEREGAASAEVTTTSTNTEAKLADIAGLLGGIAAIHITSLEAAASIADDTLPNVEGALDLARLGTRVRTAMQRLPDKERRLMELYYFKDKNLEEAGGVLGLSKSWACRLHARAVDLLRAELEETPD